MKYHGLALELSVEHAAALLILNESSTTLNPEVSLWGRSFIESSPTAIICTCRDRPFAFSVVSALPKKPNSSNLKLVTSSSTFRCRIIRALDLTFNAPYCRRISWTDFVDEVKRELSNNISLFFSHDVLILIGSSK